MIVFYKTKSGGTGRSYFKLPERAFFYAIRLLDNLEIIKVQISIDGEIYSIKKD